jgi:hypothetical protein
MRRPVLFAALSGVLVCAAGALIYAVGVPMLEGGVISCAPAGTREHALGCMTPFSAFAFGVVFVLALAIAHLWRRLS